MALQALRPLCRKHGGNGRVHLRGVALVQGRDQRVLVGKVLVERTHAHTCALGHQIGVGGGVAAFCKNASRGLQNGLDRGKGTRLPWLLAGLGRLPLRRLRMRVFNASHGSYSPGHVI